MAQAKKAKAKTANGSMPADAVALLKQDHRLLGESMLRRKQNLMRMFEGRPPMPETRTLRAARKLRQGHATI